MKDMLENTLRNSFGTLSDRLTYDPHWPQLRYRKRKYIPGKPRVAEPTRMLRELLCEVIAQAIAAGDMNDHRLFEEANKRVVAHNAAGGVKLEFPNVTQMNAVLGRFPKVDVIRARDGEKAAEAFLRIQGLRARHLH